MEAQARRIEEMEFDTQKAQAFGDRMLRILNDSALALMSSIGHRTGLFDTMAASGALTAPALARAAKLDERYVREWLGAMVTGGIVEYHVSEGTYRLPAEHAASLTRAAVPANAAASMQWVAVLGGVEDRIVDCFRNGGGVPYEAYPRFHEVMIEESNQTVLAGLVEHILPVVPGLIDRLNAGIDVIDVGCGSGRAINLMAQTFPNSRFTGADVSPEGIANATAEAARLGLKNARFQQVDVAKLGADGEYDLVTTFDAVHDQAKPDAVLRNIHAALRPGGVYLCQDIGASSHMHENAAHPMGPFLYTISCMHCMTVSLAAGGAGLGAMWGEHTARAMLREAGFTDVVMHRLPHDIQNYYYVGTK